MMNPFWAPAHYRVIKDSLRTNVLLECFKSPFDKQRDVPGKVVSRRGVKIDSVPSAQSQLRGEAEEQREINKIQMTKNDQGGGGRAGGRRAFGGETDSEDSVQSILSVRN